MSQEMIYNLARTNPTVMAWITTYQYNRDVSYTDALEGIVVSLAEQNDDLSRQLIECLTTSVRSNL